MDGASCRGKMKDAIVRVPSSAQSLLMTALPNSNPDQSRETPFHENGQYRPSLVSAHPGAPPAAPAAAGRDTGEEQRRAAPLKFSGRKSVCGGDVQRRVEARRKRVCGSEPPEQ